MALPIIEGSIYPDPGGFRAAGVEAEGIGGKKYRWTGVEWSMLTAAQLESLSLSVPADGGAFALSESVGVVTLTATGTAMTGACKFRGITVRALSGTPQTVTVYDATSATGAPIATFTVSAIGTFFWDGDWATPGAGKGGRRVNTIGCHVVISGGASRTIDVMVE